MLERQPSQYVRAAGALVPIALYALILWCWFRPDFVQSWRETDTQSIARHLAEPGSSIFYPRIDWGGSGEGYVETEFQLYPWLIALFLRVFGDVEWPGQLISVLAVAGAAWVVFGELGRRYGSVPAVFALAAFLVPRGVVLAATVIQPEALCLLLYASAWFAFERYASSGSRGRLASYAVLGLTAMLVKPTAAQLGISSFVLLLLGSRERLRSLAPWFAWAFMVGGLVLYLLHARQLYVQYGNTFGVLSGGDSKLPHLEHLLVPKLYAKAALNAVLWGLGPVGAAAALIALFLGTDRAPIVALLVGNAVWTLLALRYTSDYAGRHYHLLGAVLAAESVAQVVARVTAAPQRLWARAALGAGVFAALLDSLHVRRAYRSSDFDAPAVAVAKALSTHARQRELVVVRSTEPAYDSFWKTPSNFQDPRVFYLSRTHGWPVASDDARVESVRRPALSGARFYVETVERPAIPELDAWLSSHATLLDSTQFGGRVYALSH